MSFFMLERMRYWKYGLQYLFHKGSVPMKKWKPAALASYSPPSNRNTERVAVGVG